MEAMLTKTLLYGELVCPSDASDHVGSELAGLNPKNGDYFSVTKQKYLSSFGETADKTGYLIATESLDIRKDLEALAAICEHSNFSERELLDFEKQDEVVAEHEASNDEIVTKAPAVFR